MGLLSTIAPVWRLGIWNLMIAGAVFSARFRPSQTISYGASETPPSADALRDAALLAGKDCMTEPDRVASRLPMNHRLR